MQLHRRLEKLEAKVAPTGTKIIHLVSLSAGETEDEACARYGKEIGQEDDIIFLVGMEPVQ
jgi:hypothetical protein